MSLSIRQIRYFLAVAEAGKMSRAATTLGISQSSITAAVKALEDETGVPLLRRHRQGVALTHEGYQFLRHARHVMSAVAEATHAVHASRPQVSGRVTLGVTYTVVGYFLAPLLERFRRAFPGVAMRLVEQERRSLETMVKDRKVDLGVMLVSNLRSAELDYEVLIRSKRRLWLSANHPLAKESPLTLARIAEEPYVMLTIDEADKTAMRYWRAGGLKPKVIFRTSSVEAVRSMVANGGGVAVLSDMVYRPWSLEGDRVEAHNVQDDVPSMDVGLVWRRGAELSQGAAAFAEFCHMNFNNPAAARRAPYD